MVYTTTNLVMGVVIFAMFWHGDAKLNTKFEQLWYHKTMLNVHFKLMGQNGVQTYFILII